MKKRRLNFFGGFSSVRSAILFPFLSMIFFLVISFLVISFNYTETTVLNNAIENTGKLVKQVSTDVDSYISYMDTVTKMVKYDASAHDFLFNADLSEGERQEVRDRLSRRFQTLLDSRPDIYNMAIIKDKDHYLINDGKYKLNPYGDITNQDWYKKTLKRDDFYLSSSHVQNNLRSGYHWVITMSTALKNESRNTNEGVFFIDFNYSSISSLCTDNKIGKRGYMFIIDSKGNLIYHPKQQLIYGGLQTENIEEILDCKENYFVLNEGNDQKLYTLSRSKKTGWIVVGTAYVSELLKDNKRTQMIYMTVGGCMMMLVLILSNLIANTITEPILKLKRSMQKVESGKFDNVNVEIHSNNELGSLSNSFNVMAEQIQLLMEENIKEQKQKRKSELRALQSQINPHFLYNTLDSIIWMAESEKTEEVVDMTSALAKLLRRSISNEDELVRLDDELSMVKNYLTIQKMRYQDKLEYSVSIEEEVRSCKIIKLTLQPLVENAIYHGLKYKKSKGMLKIDAYKAKDKLCIEISDDGVGMSRDKLEHIFEKHRVNYHSNGIGVYNVKQRLNLYYGEEASIECFSEENIGTRVVIKIPITEEVEYA